MSEQNEAAGGGCGFLAYHVSHDYRNARDEPRRCPGLYPPRDLFTTPPTAETTAGQGGAS